MIITIIQEMLRGAVFVAITGLYICLFAPLYLAAREVFKERAARKEQI